MNIFENFNTAKQKYGNELVLKMCNIGIPDHYLLSACRFFQEGVDPTSIKNDIRQWMTYVVKTDKTIDINKLSYEQFRQVLQKFKQHYKIPNIVFHDGNVTIGKLKSHKDICKFPFENKWCIKSHGRFDQYKERGRSFYIIDNGDECDWIRYVVLMITKDGKKVYYDIANTILKPNSIVRLNKLLTPKAIEYISKLSENKQYK